MRRATGSIAAFALALACAACTTMAPSSAGTSPKTPAAAADELIAADRAFSAASARTDLISGLSAMFAPDVAMPIPGSRFSATAAEAIEALRANPDNARSRTEWTPVRGGISADGLQGYTWGYMTLVRPDGSTAPLKYLSYWTKRPEGWRVVAYKRRQRPAGEVSTAPVAPTLPARMVAATSDPSVIQRYLASLDATERAFSDESKVIGLGVAFERYGRADAVNMGGPNDAAFVVGPEAIGRLVSDGKPAAPSTLSWAPDRTIVASSGDLGVTIGIIRESAPVADPKAPTTFPFFTIWHRASVDDPWRYVAE